MIHWTGFDAALGPTAHREPNARLISEMRNALPALLDAAARYAQITEKATAFLDKLDEITPAVVGAFQMAQIHGMPYTGPNWKAEYDALRLAMLPAGERTET